GTITAPAVSMPIAVSASRRLRRFIPMSPPFSNTQPADSELRKFEEQLEVLRRCKPDLFRRRAAKLCYRSGRLNNVSRFVATPAIRHGRKERAVSFDQHSIQRQILCRVAQVFSFFERDHTRKGNQEAKLDCGFGKRAR